MKKIDAELTNKGFIAVLFLIFFFLFSILIVIPGSSFIFSPFSEFANFFRSYFWFILLFLSLLLAPLPYIYSYTFKIDAYVLYIINFNLITRFFRGKKTLEISHVMLKRYTFSKHFLTNTVLLLELETSSGRKVSRKFIFSFFREKDQSHVKRMLDQIIQENNS